MRSELLRRQPSGDRPPIRRTLEQREAAPVAPAQGSVGHNASFEILEGLGDACALFDPGGRLLFCNRAYRELFDTIVDQLVVGARLEDLVRAKVRRGQFARHQSATELVRRYLALHQHSDGIFEIGLARRSLARACAHE